MTVRATNQPGTIQLKKGRKENIGTPQQLGTLETLKKFGPLQKGCSLADSIVAAVEKK